MFNAGQKFTSLMLVKLNNYSETLNLEGSCRLKAKNRSDLIALMLSGIQHLAK